MKSTKHDTYAALKQVFHEPSRMAIVTALCAREEGASFAELRKWCGLTDGNLNRHLKMLREAGAVYVIKVSDAVRTHTQIHMTTAGKDQFIHYLQALERALHATAGILAAQEQEAAPVGLWNLQSS